MRGEHVTLWARVDTKVPVNRLFLFLKGTEHESYTYDFDNLINLKLEYGPNRKISGL